MGGVKVAVATVRAEAEEVKAAIAAEKAAKPEDPGAVEDNNRSQ